MLTITFDTAGDRPFKIWQKLVPSSARVRHEKTGDKHHAALDLLFARELRALSCVLWASPQPRPDLSEHPDALKANALDTLDAGAAVLEAQKVKKR